MSSSDRRHEVEGKPRARVLARDLARVRDRRAVFGDEARPEVEREVDAEPRVDEPLEAEPAALRDDASRCGTGCARRRARARDKDRGRERERERARARGSVGGCGERAARGAPSPRGGAALGRGPWERQLTRGPTDRRATQSRSNPTSLAPPRRVGACLCSRVRRRPAAWNTLFALAFARTVPHLLILGGEKVLVSDSEEPARFRLGESPSACGSTAAGVLLHRAQAIGPRLPRPTMTCRDGRPSCGKVQGRAVSSRTSKAAGCAC